MYLTSAHIPPIDPPIDRRKNIPTAMDNAIPVYQESSGKFPQ